MSQEKADTSPQQNQGDAKSGNLTAAEAANQLLQRYTPKPVEAEKPKPEVAEVPPAQAEDVATEGSSTEPPAQSEETPQEQPKEEGGDVLSHDTDLTPEERDKFKAVTERWQEGVNKRVGKEKQKRLDAEERARALEEQLQKAQAEKPEPVVVAAPTADNPLADVVDSQTLATREKEANNAVYQAQTLLDQLEDAGKSEIQIGETTYTKQMLRDIRREAERSLREHIPNRQRFLAQKSEFDKMVKRDVPEILDPKSSAYKEAQQARMMYPQLATLPNGDYLIGLALRGARALAAEQVAKTKPSTTQKPPASQTAVSAAVSTQTRAKPKGYADWEAEKERVFANGNVSAAQATELLRKRQLSTSR